MRKAKIAVVVSVLVGLLAVGCAERADDTPGSGAVETRLEQLDQRLERAEERATLAAAALRKDLRDLERRLGGAEARLREALAALQSHVEAEVAQADRRAAAGELAGGRSREARMERRSQLRTLRQAYRARIADVREQYRDDVGTPEWRAAIRETMQWYRQERRAIMRRGRFSGSE